MPELLTVDGDGEGEDEGPTVGDGVGVTRGVGVGDAVGTGVYVGEGVAGALTMFAVIVPGPLTVAVVELRVEKAKVIFDVSDDQEENR